jgi:hypothetical protein
VGIRADDIPSMMGAFKDFVTRAKEHSQKYIVHPLFFFAQTSPG